MVSISKDIYGAVTVSNVDTTKTLYKSSDGINWYPVVNDYIDVNTSTIVSLDLTKTTVVDYQPWFAWKAIPITGSGNGSSVANYFNGTCRAAMVVSSSQMTDPVDYLTTANGVMPIDLTPIINGVVPTTASNPVSGGDQDGDDPQSWQVNWGSLYSSITNLTVGIAMPAGPFTLMNADDWDNPLISNFQAFMFIMVSNFYAQTGQTIGYWQGSGAFPTSFDSTVATVEIGVDRLAFLEADSNLMLEAFTSYTGGPTANPSSGYLGQIIATLSLSKNPALFPICKSMFENVRTYYMNFTVPSGTPGLNNTNLSNPDYLYNNWIGSSVNYSCLEMGRWLSRLYYAWKLTGDSYYLDGINTMSAWVLNSWPTYNNKLQFYNFYDTASGPPNGTYVTASNQYLVLLCGLSMVYLDPGCSLYNNTALYTIIQATVDGLTSNINDKGLSYGEMCLGSAITINKVLGDSDPIVGTSNVLSKLASLFSIFQSTEPCYITCDEHRTSNTPQILALRNYWYGTPIDQTVIDIDIYVQNLAQGPYGPPNITDIGSGGYFGIGLWMVVDANVVMKGYGADVDVLNSWGSPVLQAGAPGFQQQSVVIKFH